MDVEINPLAEVLNDLDSAVALFDQIFSEVAPTKKLNDHSVSYKISKKSLSDIQLEAVKRLAGFLLHANSTAGELRERSPEYLRLKAVPTPFILSNEINVGAHLPGSVLDESSKDVTAAILREYLVLSLVEAESLKKKVKRLEQELTDAGAETNKLIKKLENSDASQRKSAQESKLLFVEQSVADLNDGDEMLMNMFIRKDFGGTFYFGLVTRCFSPYYEVVYEDGDYEDVTKQEIVRLLWNGHVASEKADLCKKHFIRISKEKEKEKLKNAISSSNSSSSGGSKSTLSTVKTEVTSSSSSSSNRTSSSRATRTSPAATSKSTPSKPGNVSHCSLLTLSDSKKKQPSSLANNTSAVSNAGNDGEEGDDHSTMSRVVTTDSLSLCDDLRAAHVSTLPTGQKVTSAVLVMSSQLVNLDAKNDDLVEIDSRSETEASVSENSSSSDSSVLIDNDEVVMKREVDLSPLNTSTNTAAHRISVESISSSSSSSDSSNSNSRTSPKVSSTGRSWKAVSIGGSAKRKLDQTSASPAVSTSSNSVKRAAGTLWTVDAAPDDNVSLDSDVVFIGSNPAPN